MKTAHYGVKIGAAVALASACAMGLSTLHAALAPTSYQMTDVIAGGSGNNAGKGSIRVLTTKSVTLTGPDLEAFRAESVDGKTLSFVVDVNENASGLETARAQGVAVKSAKLVVVAPGVANVEYSHFWTETRALIAEASDPTHTRKLWYTLLGDAGSNEIAGRKIGNTVYDSTLKFEVTGTLSTATSVTLVIELLKTDSSFGDPENFYDYSGGFEDMALITKSTAKVFDVFVPYMAAVAFRTESPGATLSPEGTTTLTTTLAEVGGAPGVYTDTTSSPGTTYTYTIPADLVGNALLGDLGAAGYQIVAFEDMYPDTGDYDFNDVVVAHRLLNTLDSAGRVIAISGDAYLVARGAGGFNHRWSLDIPIAGATVGAFICNVKNNESSTEIVNSDTLASSDALACKVAMVSGSPVARITGFRDTRALLPLMNTLAGDSPSLGSVPHMNFSIALSAPVAASAVGTASPWIEISRSTLPMSGVAFGSSANKVTLATRDSQSKPYAMLIPSDWQVPVEGTDIGLAYPDFAIFVGSGGSNNASWYQKPDQKNVVRWRVKDIAQ